MELFLKSKKPEAGTLTAEVWKITISDGLMGAIHGQFHSIYEVFFPQLGMAVNYEGRENILFPKPSRYKSASGPRSIGYNVDEPKRIKVITLKGKEAEAVRNMAEIQFLVKGINKEAQPFLKELLKEEKTETSSLLG